MKQDISTLMDGELCDEEAEILLDKIKRHPEARQEWLSYHLIGDVLRQPDGISNNLSAAFLERLHAEPTVLAPTSRRKSKAAVFAMSAAASIMAMALLAWLSIQLNNETQPQFATLQRPNALRTVSYPVNDGMSDYLLAHQEYSPATEVRGAASYIRNVAARQTGSGK